MNVLSGFPRSCFSDYDNDLMFSVLSGELANNIGPGSMGFYCPSQNKTKGQRRTNSPIHKNHPFAHILATFFEPRVFCNIDQNAASE